VFYGATPTVVNCLITENHNSAIGGGGVAAQQEGNPVFVNCTITNNTSDSYGGGIDIYDSDITLKNTIVWGNENPGDAAYEVDEISITDSGDPNTITLDHCDYANEEGDIFMGPVTPIVVETACINSDPLFREPASGNFLLRYGSPCLDTGLNASLPGGITTDLNGLPRIYDGDGSMTDEVDIGCFELEVGFVPLQYATIQAALDAVQDGSYVVVAEGTYTGAGNRDLDTKGTYVFLMSQGGPSACVIDCQDLGRGFYIHSGETNDTVIQGFTVRNGLAASNGGAVFCQNAGPLIRNCIVECSKVGAGNGGGIYCDSSGGVRFVNCIIRDNVVPAGDLVSGGGICIEDTSSAEMVNCLIVDNSAEGGNLGGGGVAVIATDITMTSCTVAGNYSGTLAFGGGGGILCRAGTVNFNNSIVWGNEQVNDFTQEINIRVTTFYPSSPNPEFDANASCLDISMNPTIVDRTFLSPDADCVSADPIYVDAANGDYRLQVTSPVRDEGINGFIPSDVTTDLDGNPRIANTTVDMGAYEYQ